MFSQSRSLRVASLAFALALAPVAHAETLPSRDTGVGLLIAAQGNQALLAIRAELKRALKGMRPSMPARALPVSTPEPRQDVSPGGAFSVAPTQRCAK